MLFLLIGITVVIVVFGPQIWARYIFQRYNQSLSHLPGTGGELARHLLDRFDLTHISLERTDVGDHYDPESKTVRLSPENFDGKSLTAVSVAAHEVGHAIQHAENHPMLTLRTQLVKKAVVAQKIGSIAMIAIPIVTMITRAPSAGILLFVAAIASMFVSTIVHLVTLPVEWDASFGKALPLLKKGQYISEKEIKISEKILKAAALTYVASSLASLLNLWRWIAILRR